MRQAVVVSVSVNERKSNPTSIAPIILAMATSTNKRINEKSIVPNIPVIKTESTGQRQFVLSSAPQSRVDASVTARKPTATPNNTQSKGVPTVSVPISVRNVATTPIITLTITARLVQLIYIDNNSLLKSSPNSIYAVVSGWVILFCLYLVKSGNRWYYIS